ncbi:MAG TPA: hypothetical protein VK395_32530 [Gemmataceae bacterium]|nr:hypothetical protein [Gemmataceae bacterium]
MLNSTPWKIDADEELIADIRGGVTPAQVVEGKLWTLLGNRGYGVSLHQTDGPAHPRRHVERALRC